MIRTQNGNSLLLVLILSAMVMAAFASVQVLISSFDQRVATLRVKNQQRYFETRLRNLAGSPDAYRNCNGGAVTCEFQTQLINDLKSAIAVTGSACGNSTSPCRFDFVPAAGRSSVYDPQTKSLVGQIRFSGKAEINALDVSMSIPQEVLQSSQFRCPAVTGGAQPILRGINLTTGSLECRGIQNCGPGQYMTGVNAVTAQPICEELPTQNISCDAGSFVSRLEWQGAQNVSFSCSPRLDPFDHFGMSGGGSMTTGSGSMASSAPPSPPASPSSGSSGGSSPGPTAEASCSTPWGGSVPSGMCVQSFANSEVQNVSEGDYGKCGYTDPSIMRASKCNNGSWSMQPLSNPSCKLWNRVWGSCKGSHNTVFPLWQASALSGQPSAACGGVKAPDTNISFEIQQWPEVAGLTAGAPYACP